MIKGKTLNITDQINTQYRSYAIYVLQSRGIPNFYDSLTPVQRLIVENSPNKYNKTIGLVGEVIKTGLYHHSDTSLSGSISRLARTFGCAFSILEGDGFFGSPVNPNPSAARYTSVRINQKMKEIITKNSDLNEKNEEGGHNWIHTEVPIGLLTHTIGIAVGYRSNILPRKYEDIVEYLGGASKVLKPFFKDFGGKISKYMDGENTWLIESIFSTDFNKKVINIADLPPVMRYDSFINKLEIRLAKSGFDYRLENRSKIKCDLSIQIKGVITKEEFNSLALNISKLTKMIVKEDIIYIKDGNVMEFTSVKEYLDHFKGHLELVRLKRLIRNVENDTREQEYLEAKVLFLIFMMEKKRKNVEIVKFLSDFANIISIRLQRIEIVKLSLESLKQTKEEIETLKKNILKIKKEIKEQEKEYKRISADIHKNNKTVSKKIQNGLFEVDHYNGIEIFEVEEEVEEEQEEEFNN